MLNKEMRRSARRREVGLSAVVRILANPVGRLRAGTIGSARVAALLFWCFILSACVAHNDQARPDFHSKFQPVDRHELTSKTQPTYRIGVGDQLQVVIQTRSDFKKVIEQSVVVDTDGSIYIPLVGSIKAEGLTEGALRKEVERLISSELRSPLVSVSIVDARGKRVFVLGEVNKPGVYALESNSNVIEMLLVAGGYTQDADISKIALLRREPTSGPSVERRSGATLDVQSLLQQAETRDNITIEPGDIVYVPPDRLAKSSRYYSHVATVFTPFIDVINTGASLYRLFYIDSQLTTTTTTISPTGQN